MSALWVAGLVFSGALGLLDLFAMARGTLKGEYFSGWWLVSFAFCVVGVTISLNGLGVLT